MIIPQHPSIAHQMQQVQFDALDIRILNGAADIFLHHLDRLAWQAIDQMGTDTNIVFAQAGDAV